jgi:KDO2-lipid IV(A) lauroyltransferase
MARPSKSLVGILTHLRDAAVAGLFLLAITPLILLPVDRAVALAGRVGRAALPWLPASRRIHDNLALVRADIEPARARALVADVGDNFMRTLAEYIRLPTLAAMPERRDVEGMDHLTTAVAHGRGAIIVSAHFGNWEMLRLAARDAGIEVGIIYRAFNNASFDWLAMLRIRSAGEPVLHKGRDGLRDMLAVLRRGGVMLVLLDQHMSRGEPLPFLGRPALTPTAIAALCRRSGATLITARATRRADGVSFAIRFEPPIAGGDPVAMTAEMNERIGHWVDQHPGQWFWLHRRWRGGAGETVDAAA